MTESFNRKLGRLAQSVSGTGTITTNAATASAWETARTLTLGGDLSGSVSIDGTSNVSLTATVTGDSIVLGTDTTGDYVAAVAVSGTGLSVSGSGENATYTITSNATSANTASTIVARDASGNFSAGTITAALSGNATTATTLQTARTINGVSFNGSGDITVTAAAGTLTGNTLASGVTSSSLTSVGTLSSLTVSGDLTVDTNTLFVDSANNRVGVGTASPAVTLTAVSAVGGQAVARMQNTDVNGFSGIEFADTAGNTDLYIGLEQGGGAARFNSLDGGFRFYTTGTERMRIDASGNVGIGTTSPIANLHVQGSSVYLSTTDDYASGTTGSGLIVARGAATGNTYSQIYGVQSGGTSYANLVVPGGNVGIGTTSPSEKFEVYNGGLSVNSGTVKTVVSYAGTTSKFGTTTNHPLLFITNNTERARIDASGNLGIGVTPSAWTSASRVLQIGGATNNRLAFNGTVNTVSSNAYWDTANNRWEYIGTGNAVAYAQDTGSLVWLTSASGTADYPITFTQAMTLDASGNLGIGVTPSAWEAGKAIQFGTYGAVSSSLQAGVNTQITNNTYFDGTNYRYIASQEASIIQLGRDVISFASATAGSAGSTIPFTERARITAGGYFKASNDGTYLNATGFYHESRQAANGNVIHVNSHKGTDPYGVFHRFSAASPDNNTNYFAWYEDSTTVRCIIYSDGDILNHDGVYGTLSDAKLKQDITDAGSQWDDLKAIRFRKYRFKSDVEQKGDDAPYLLGVVAQELQAVSPGLVDAHPDTEQVEVEVEVEKTRPVMHEVEEIVTDAEGVESVVTKSVPKLDEDGQPFTETYTETETRTETRQTGTETLSVKQSILLMKAAVALQEAMARIETLEARLAALEAK